MRTRMHASPIIGALTAGLEYMFPQTFNSGPKLIAILLSRQFNPPMPKEGVKTTPSCGLL